MFQEIAMQMRAAGPNKWELFQTVPNASGYTGAPPADEVLITFTDADLASALNSLATIDDADGSVSRLMKEHARVTAEAAARADLAARTAKPWNQTPLNTPIEGAPVPASTQPAADAHDQTLVDTTTGEGMPEPARTPGTV